MMAEVVTGTAVAGGGTGLGGQSFVDASVTDKKYGFYVDLGAQGLLNKVGFMADGTTANPAYVGAQRAEGFLNAFGMAYKDYEPEWAYLVVSPETMASFRSANLIDQDRIVDGNINFNTIFNGKFRLIQTRATQGLSSTEKTKANSGAGVDLVGTKTSFLVLPGAIAMTAIPVPEPVEIWRNAASYKGGGTTEIWRRWGYIMHPAGYDWVGSQVAFASDASYSYVCEATTPKALTACTDVLTGVTGTWVRKTTTTLTLGILPIFHG
jgi:hypothetical protein